MRSDLVYLLRDRSLKAFQPIDRKGFLPLSQYKRAPIDGAIVDEPRSNIADDIVLVSEDVAHRLISLSTSKAGISCSIL